MNKKGELSLQIVVVSILSLLVLVVLIAIFTGNIGPFVGSLKDCAGTYKGSCKLTCDNGEVIVSKPTDCNKQKIVVDGVSKTKICCKPLELPTTE